jgi:hypothetical protein
MIACAIQCSPELLLHSLSLQSYRARGWLQLDKECKQRQFTVLQVKVLRGLCNWRRLPDSPGREGRIATQRWGELAFTQRPFALRARRCRARIHRQRGIICGQCHWYGTMSVLPSHVPSRFGSWNIEMISPVGRTAKRVPARAQYSTLFAGTYSNTVHWLHPIKA